MQTLQNTTERQGIRAQRIGTGILRYGSVVMLVLGGASKWTRDEAAGIQAYMANSPLMSWIYRVLSLQHASEAIGIVEITLAVMIVLRHWQPRISAVGSALSVVMFVLTLSFLFTTPKLSSEGQGFLMKDVFMLGAAVLCAGEALRAAASRERRLASVEVVA